MSGIPRQVLLAALAAPLLVAGCFAEQPLPYKVDGGGTAEGPYPSIGVCTPASGRQVCPGEGCGSNAAGPPDGNSINLKSCGTLDLLFTSGTVVADALKPGEPDLAVHFGTAPAPSVSVRVEGSADGNDYIIIGFIGIPPAGTHPFCKATVAGTRALVDASRCNLISNVNFVRFSEERPGTGDVTIDAVEALSFKSKSPR